MGILWMLSAFVSASWAQPCTDPAVVVGQAKSALIDARMEEVAERIQDVEAALGCAALASPELLSELWMIEGVRLYFAEDPSGASRAFAASARLHPLPWTPEYGLALKAFYDEAVAAPRGEGRLLLYEVPEGISAALDGVPTTFPAVVPEGPHLVQVLSEDAALLDAHLVMLPPGEAVEIRVGPLAPAAALPPAATERRRRPALLVGSGASAVLAGGAYVLARGQDGAMEGADGIGVLNDAYTRQKVLAGATYGLAGLSAAGVGLYFAL